jgi:uncharacterized membrane protein
MIRRRQVPWIHKYSRLIIGTIAVLGAINTGYLTWEKLSQNPAMCGTEACNIVLTSPFANVGDLPLSGFGLLSYLAVAVMAFAPMLVNPQTNRNAHQQLNNLTWLGLFIAGTGMAIFSGYLMWLLAFEIKAACPFCIASAIFSASIFVLAIIGREWDDIGQTLFTGIGVGLLTMVVSLLLYNGAKGIALQSLRPVTAPEPGIGWEIKSKSGTAEFQLAEYLTKQGAKMYGAYSCSHCYEQKQLFGKQAWEKVNYIECIPDAKNHKPQPELCQKAGIKGFPTWEINGKLNPGAKKLAKLAEITSYKGDTQFKYDELFGK